MSSNETGFDMLFNTFFTMACSASGPAGYSDPFSGLVCPIQFLRELQMKSLLAFLLVSLLLIGTARIATDISIHEFHHWLFSPVYHSQIDEEFAIAFKNGCNLFDGKWVLEEDGSRPLYTEDGCPYLTQPVTCQRNGRPDLLYQRWNWRPHQCKLPRFDALKLLTRLRNKRLMFIGDSIQRTQWESMVCLLQSAVPDSKKSVYKDPPRRIFFAQEYNATVEFYWAPFIVESNSDHTTKHTVQKRQVRLDSVAKHSKKWEGADILVFESYVWWMYRPFINATIGSPDIKEYDILTAYKLALQTWANWLESSFNPLTQKAFFMSLSPTHLWSYEWRPGSKENCFNETRPIEGRPFWGAGSSLEIMKIVGDALRGMKAGVTLLNITQLSEFRKDGHTSVYTERRGKLLTSEERSEPNIYADCIHWCLPGVPDTWNEILYAYLLYRN